MQKTLVVIHPGSACGSADFNLGGITAAQCRERLADTLHKWTGQVIVIDGELSDELEHYATPALALNNHHDHGRLKRTKACDMSNENWVEEACSFIAKHVAKNSMIILTGAWHEKEGIFGCINAVQQHLDSRGFKTEVSPCALTID